MADIENERKIVLAIEKANLRLKKIISGAMLMPQVNRYTAKLLVDELLIETRKELESLEADRILINSTENGIKETFLVAFAVMLNNLKASVKKANIGEKEKAVIEKKITALEPIKKTPSERVDTTPVINKQMYFATTETRDDIGFTITSKGVGRVEITNLRDFLTEYDEAADGYYINYPEAVRDAMKDIQLEVTKGNISMTDSLGRKKSLRNMAEMSVRYNLIQDDLKRLGNVKYVIATQHSNASERCSWWQGKIFLVDFDVEGREMGEYPGAEVVRPLVRPIGYIDGKPYYSLQTACENGFLSYNCQHRLVKYEYGMHVPKERDFVSVDKRRDISQKQRYLEREIRDAKTQELVLNGEDRKKAIARSKKLQQEYRDFCQKHNVPRYDWRCQVS